MAVLWYPRSIDRAEVREHLDDPLAYTTVLTVLRTAGDEGIRQPRGGGKAHRYTPRSPAIARARPRLGQVLGKIFGGRGKCCWRTW